MIKFGRITALLGIAEAARRYARSHPDQAGKYLDQAAQFVDKQTSGKYTNQITGVARKAKDVAGIPQPGYGYGAPGTTPPATPPASENGSGAYGQTQGYPSQQPGQSEPPRP